MTITPRVKELKEDAEEEEQQPQQEREFIHQKEHANPDKFQRKNKLKKEVEDIFYLDGSKQLRNDYIKENIRDQIDRKKKRTWSEVFGIVRDDPNSQEIVLCLALIFVFVGILSTLICCICLYWWQDRQRLQYLELTTPNYNTAEFKEHYNQVIQKQHFKIKNAAQDLEMLEQRSLSPGSSRKTKSGSSQKNNLYMGSGSQFDSAQGNARVFKGSLGNNNDQFNYQSHSGPIVTQEINNQNKGPLASARSNPEGGGFNNIFKLNQETNHQTMDTSRQGNAFGALAQSQSNNSAQANNNLEMIMFNNQNDGDTSRMEDVGGADGLEGVAYKERETANWQERVTANFADFQTENRSSNKTRGTLSNTLQQKANDVVTNSAGYQQMVDEDDEQMERGGNDRQANQNSSPPKESQEDQLRALLKQQNDAAERYLSEQNSNSEQ